MIFLIGVSSIAPAEFFTQNKVVFKRLFVKGDSLFVSLLLPAVPFQTVDVNPRTLAAVFRFPFGNRRLGKFLAVSS